MHSKFRLIDCFSVFFLKFEFKNKKKLFFNLFKSTRMANKKKQIQFETKMLIFLSNLFHSFFHKQKFKFKFNSALLINSNPNGALFFY